MTVKSSSSPPSVLPRRAVPATPSEFGVKYFPRIYDGLSKDDRKVETGLGGYVNDSPWLFYVIQLTKCFVICAMVFGERHSIK